jgi:hypothetical protein
MDASEEYHTESMKALEGSEAHRALAQKKAELGMLLAERGERERAVSLLKESMDLSKSISAGDIASMADAELKRITGSEGQ